MSTATTLANQWRPRTLDAVIGQDPVVLALRHGLSQGHHHPAYCFTGTRGVGKTSLGRILAACLNCETGVTATPCGQCASCQAIRQDQSMDLIEIDAASRTKVEDTRTLLDNVPYAPAQSRYKIYLIDEVHMLSTHSFNALLKTLEEPPAHVVFILATTDPQKIPVTVLSRCLQFHLRALTPDQLQTHCEHILQKQQINSEPQALALIAKAARGSVRDALSLLDQAILQGAGQVLLSQTLSMLGLSDQEHIEDLVQALFQQDRQAVFDIVDEMLPFVPDYYLLIDQLAEVFFNCAKLQVIADDTLNERYQQWAQSMTPETLQLYYQIAINARRDCAYAPSLRQGFEMMLLRMLYFYPEVADQEIKSETATSTPKNTLRSNKSTQSAAATDLKKSTQSLAAVSTKTQSKTAHSSKNSLSTNTKAAAARKTSKPSQLSQVDTQTADVTDAAAIIQNTAAKPLEVDSWDQLIKKCEIKGTALLLAQNCSLESFEGSVIHLMISPTMQPMNTATAQKGLTAALSAWFGQVIKVNISEGEANSLSPHDAQQVQDQQRQDELDKALESDPNVQNLLKTFDGSKVS